MASATYPAIERSLGRSLGLTFVEGKETMAEVLGLGTHPWEFYLQVLEYQIGSHKANAPCSPNARPGQAILPIPQGLRSP